MIYGLSFGDHFPDVLAYDGPFGNDLSGYDVEPHAAHRPEFERANGLLLVGDVRFEVLAADAVDGHIDFFYARRLLAAVDELLGVLHVLGVDRVHQSLLEVLDFFVGEPKRRSQRKRARPTNRKRVFLFRLVEG